MKKIVLLLLTSLLIACSASKTGLDKYEGQSAQQIFTGADKSLVQENYKDAIERYETLQAFYPYGDYAEQTLLNVIYAYYCERAYDSVLSAADRYIHLYPRGAHIDYVYYLKGLAAYSRNFGFFERYFPLDIANRSIKNVEQSFTDFTELLIRFPNSAYAADARQRMVFLRNTLAGHQLKIATYYYARKAWLAAAERAANIVSTYQHTPAVEKALIIMVKSYRQLGLKGEEQRAIAVLKANYPASLKDVKDVAVPVKK